MPKSWQQRLVDLHPELFIRTFRGVPVSAGYPRCGDGWRNIVAKLVDRVSAAAIGYPIHFTQIQENHGRLTIYWTAEATLPRDVEGRINEAIAKAEARSACTCVICGSTGRLFSNEGCLATCCSEHAAGFPVPVPPGMEDLHVVRPASNDSLSLACRRYDRDHDRFVDIDPISLGFGHWQEILVHLGNPGGGHRWRGAPSIKAP